MARALNDTVSAGCPAIGSGTLATSVAGPALLPRVQTTVAMPCASVRVVAALSEPSEAVQVTGALDSRVKPEHACVLHGAETTFTCMLCGNAVLTNPTCPPPATASRPRRFKAPDGREVVAGPVQPWTWQIAEVFKLEKGKISKIDAFLQRSPYGMNSGWSTWEQGMSDQVRDVTFEAPTWIF